MQTLLNPRPLLNFKANLNTNVIYKELFTSWRHMLNMKPNVKQKHN